MICKSDEKTAHRRYGDLYKLIKDKDKDLANAFDGLSRSKAFTQLMLMYRMGLVEEKQLDEFEDETKNSISRYCQPGRLMNSSNKALQSDAAAPRR